MARKGGGGLVHRVVAPAVLVVAAALCCPAVASADWLDGEQRLTSGAGVEQWPQVGDDTVAYAADAPAGDGLDIHVRSLADDTDEVLTPAHTAAGAPAVSGHRVVWPDAGAGRAGLWVADLRTGERRRFTSTTGKDLAISGALVCYTAAGRIRVHDLDSGNDRALSPEGAGAGGCDLSGHVVVWQDHRPGAPGIYALDLRAGTEQRVTGDGAVPSRPAVDEGLVVWQDERDGDGDADIYARELTDGEERRLTDAAGAQWAPDVSAGCVVWMDERQGRGNTEVYLYDVATGIETRVTRDDGWSGAPTISRGRILYEDARASGHHLYTRSVTPPVLVAAVGPGDGQPVVSGELTGADGVPVVAADLVVEGSADGKAWQELATATTLGDGSYSVPVASDPSVTSYRVRFAGTADHAPATSDPVRPDAG